MKTQLLRHVWGGCITVVFLLSGCGQTSPVAQLPFQASFDAALSVQTDVSQDYAEAVSCAVAKAFDSFAALLPFQSKRTRPFVVTIIRDKEKFMRYQQERSATASKSGFYLADRGELVLLFQGRKRTHAMLRHEAFHAYFEDRIIHPPVWLHEGLAQYVQMTQPGLGHIALGDRIPHQWVSVLAAVFDEKRMPSLGSVLHADWGNRHALSEEEYALSWSIVYFFQKTAILKRREQFLAYLTLLYEKKDPTRAADAIWDDMEELDNEWQSFVQKTILKRKILKYIPFL